MKARFIPHAESNVIIFLSKKGYTSMEEILGQICGIIIMILCVINTQFPRRWQMLLCSAAVNLFSSLNQLLVGSGLTACFLCAVATVHCSINSYKAKKEIPERIWEKILFIVLYFTAWGIGFSFSFSNGTPLYLDLMTFVATIFFIGIVLLPKERDMRLCTLGNSVIYFTYDTINLNIAAVAKMFSIISVIVALIRYGKKEKKGIEK